MAAGRPGKQLPKAGIIIQARMDSTRLPGKVLMPLGGSTMLDILVSRLKESRLPLILATSMLPSNDVLEAKARELDIICHRGSEEDVLSRFYDAAKAAELDIIVRVTADNPLLDGKLVRSYVDEYIKQENDNLYLSTSLKKSLPIGISFEIFSFHMLETAYKNAVTIQEREHVTPYFYNDQAACDKIPVKYISDKSAYRLTVDTEKDLQLIRILIEEYHAATLSYIDIISIMDREKDLVDINTGIVQKKWNE